MTRSLPEGNCVNPVTATCCLDEFGSFSHDFSPPNGFIVQKIDWSSKMATRIEQAPTKQRSRMRMVTQEPMAIASDLYFTKMLNIGMKLTNRTVL